MAASIVVAGAVANKLGHGGEAWVRLSWVLGLEQLGCDVALVEQLAGATRAQRDYFDSTVDAFGLGGRAWLVDPNEPVPDSLLERAGEADLLVNISGHLTIDALLGALPAQGLRRPRSGLHPALAGRRPRRRPAPAATTSSSPSARTSARRAARSRPAGSTGGPCARPSCSTAWPVAETDEPDRLHDRRQLARGVRPRRVRRPTVRAEGARVPQGDRRFRPGFRSDFEIALDIHPGDERDLEQLRSHGWQLVDPREAAGTPDAFRGYVQESGAEFSVAQGIYVETSSGWFSDRTARYLACGKPALVQDTGFSADLPAGEGLVAFRTLDEAVAGAESIAADYERHCGAARALAEREFDSDVVLGRFLAGSPGLTASGSSSAGWSPAIPARAARPGPCSSTCSGFAGSGHDVVFVEPRRPPGTEASAAATSNAVIDAFGLERVGLAAGRARRLRSACPTRSSPAGRAPPTSC